MRGEDRLSNLPLNITETILCFVPIQEAGRTSILSKEWRYRWTKIPKLVFEENTFQVSAVESSFLEQEHLEPNERQKMDTKSKLIHAVGQVLLMHDGPIDEFTLSFLGSNQHVKMDHIITHLSKKNSIKKLKLDFADAEYMLPSSIFSFGQLTELCLIGCSFESLSLPTVYGYASLESLSLPHVNISISMLQQILSSCPLLKTVFLNIPSSYICGSNGGLAFTKLFELFECLPVIEALSLSFDFDLTGVLEDLVHARAPRELPTPLFHLKYLEIFNACFTRKEELILAFLIKNSPNLEKLKISVGRMSFTIWESSTRDKFYPGIMLEHLKELEIIRFDSHETRMGFVKLILARSPVLKMVRLVPQVNHHAKFHILRILLGSPHASPDVQIIVDQSCSCWRCSSSSARTNNPMYIMLV